MKLIFLDDSMQRDPARCHLGELVALGAVIVPSAQVAGFAADLSAIKDRLGVPAEEELKWKPPKGSFLAGAGGLLVTELRRSVLEAAIARQITSVVHVLDHGRVYKERAVVDVGQELLKWTYDKVAWDLDADGAVMIADKPGGGSAEESRWLANTLAVTNDGTAYTAPGKVILPVLTAASHHVPHLQLADLITAATTAAVAGRPSGMDLVPLLLQIARKNYREYVGGAGITLWPPDLRDLLYWIFDEDMYTSGGVDEPLGPTDSPFLAPGRPFQQASGLG
ncbi:hypothetical protein E1263_22595 [Kribbella antibiotica]|uniref:DUF3800 domain-containing protein n=1 Tax=Kribbella antibiotica TaxID=190195 RepID=A0A4R4ZIV7_9ACTN|nr:DUF3800 domain-containing protein [Kribbella antibiotica]TDD57684.1 hypothetical protein E1263_22595 [Kribbella antibiotica]